MSALCRRLFSSTNGPIFAEDGCSKDNDNFELRSWRMAQHQELAHFQVRSMEKCGNYETFFLGGNSLQFETKILPCQK